MTKSTSLKSIPAIFKQEFIDSLEDNRNKILS